MPFSHTVEGGIMTESLSFLVVLTAAFKYINTRWLGLPSMIGVLLLACTATLLLVMTSELFPAIEWHMGLFLRTHNLSHILLEHMLSFMLFAGALHVNIEGMKAQRSRVLVLATISTLLSACLLGSLVYGLSGLLGLKLDFLSCMIMGAILSPTDPVAVMSILRKAPLPEHVRVTVVGESLFNDGVGVALFTILNDVRSRSDLSDLSTIPAVVLQEIVLGVLVGVAIGALGVLLLRSIDHYATEVLLSVALVFVGDMIAQSLHTSSPLVAVSAGLVVASFGRRLAFTRLSEDYMNKIWEIIDETLNVALAVLIGMHIVVVPLSANLFLLGTTMAVCAPVARYLSIQLPFALVPKRKRLSRRSSILLTWCGLRGGISIALALTLQNQALQDVALVVTYAIVLFSVFVQGLSIDALARHFRLRTDGSSAA